MSSTTRAGAAGLRPRRTAALLAVTVFASSWLSTPFASAAPSDNLVVNPGFELGETGWAPGNGGRFSLSEDAASGTYSGSIDQRTAFYHGLKGTVTEPIAHDGRYRVTAKIKHATTDGAEPFGFAICPASGGCVAAPNAIQQLSGDGWSEYSLEFTPNQSGNYDPAQHEATTFSHFQFETPWSSTVSFLADDVSIVRLDDPATEPTVPTGEHVENVQTKPVGDHNPVMGHKFGADPHHLIFNDRLYIYSTSDEQQYQTAQQQPNGIPLRDGGYERITTLNVISTDDMVNWVDHGSVPVAGPAGIAKWAGNSWAPAAVAADPDGDGVEEVYLYFCNGGAGTGVIVGGSPLGPWEDPNGKMLISQGNPISFPAGMWLFDPEVFVDDDNQAYLYFGGNWDFAQDPYHPKSTRVVKLDPKDYTKLADPTGAGITTIDGPGMFEASSMFKRDGKYYYSYSSNFTVGNPTYDDKRIDGQAYPGTGQIAYMMSDSPMDLNREHFQGTAFASHGKWFPGSGGNNHSDIFSFRGKDYFTYHTQVQGISWGEALNGGRTVNYRSVHVDDIEFNDDGTIKEVEGTRAGVDQLQAFEPFRTFEAETFAWQLGVRTAETDTPSAEFPEHQGSGNTVLSKIDDGDFIGLSQVDFGKGAASVTARVKPLVEGGAIEVRLDAVDGPLVGTLSVDSETGAWGEISAQLDAAQANGVHDLFFVFAGPADSRLMEVDNWQFESVPSSPVTGTPSINSAGEKLAGEPTNVWGSAPGHAGETIVLEALLEGAWANVGTSTVNDQGGYTISLGEAASEVGSYTLRVRIGDVTSDETTLLRLRPSHADAAKLKAVSQPAFVWGSVSGQATVRTQVFIPGTGWSTSQVGSTDAKGQFVLPLTYGKDMSGTLSWRVIVDHDHGEREILPVFTQRRVAPPTATSAGSAPVGREANVWGRVDGTNPTSVWTEVLLPDGRWSKSQQMTTDDHGNYVLRLTYGQNQRGTLSWRVATQVEGLGILRSPSFTFTRY